MKLLIPSVLSLALLIPGGAALACSPPLAAHFQPELGSADIIPVGGFLYLRDGDQPTFTEEFASILDPEGETVIWETVDLDFSDAVLGIQPEGGWIVGDYLGGAFSDEGLFLTVSDTVDTTAPEIAVESWRGRNRVDGVPLPVNPCGTTGHSAGIEVSMSDPGEPVVYIIEAEHLGPKLFESREMTAFYDSFDVYTRQGDEVNLTITGFDLSGNSSTVELNSAQGCAGMRGSIADGGGSGILALLAILGLCSARVRRHAGDLYQG